MKIFPLRVWFFALSFLLLGAQSVLAQSYCQPNLTQGTDLDDYCDGVRLGSIDNWNNGKGNPGEYVKDYTSLSTNLKGRRSYILEAQNGQQNSAYIAAWIDYNNDGDFSDSGEKLGEEWANIAQVVKIQFSVPAKVSDGPTRLRVLSVHVLAQGQQDVHSACGSYLYGEAEDYTVVLSSTPVILNASTLPTAYEGFPYFHKMEASGGTPGYSWLIQNQPSWLSIDSFSGILSGTPPPGSAGSSFNCSIQVTDSGSEVDLKPFDGMVETSPQGLPFTENFENGIASYFDLIANPLAFVRAGTTANAAQAGSLGLRLDGEPGDTNWAISKGVADAPSQWPKSDQDYHGSLSWAIDGTGISDLEVSFDYKLTNASFTDWYTNLIFEWSDDGGFTWKGASDGNADVGDIYRNSTGGNFVPVSFQLNNINALNGLLQFRFRWLVKWAEEDSFSTWIGIDNLKIQDPQTSGSLLITSSSALVPGEETKVWGPVQLQASGGTPNYSWRKEDPGEAVWNWLALSSTGELSGTPPAGSAQTYAFTVIVRDSQGTEVDKNFALTIQSSSQSGNPLSITTASQLTPGQEGQSWGPLQLQASGGAPSYSWRKEDPAEAIWNWLVLSSTGELSGTPPVGSAQTYAFTVIVRDSQGVDMDKNFSLTVQTAPSGPGLTITSTHSSGELKQAEEGGSYFQGLGVSGGVAPYTWSLLSAPTWLVIDATTGELLGNVPAGSAGQNFSVGVRVEDSQTTQGTRTFSLDVVAKTTGSSNGGGGTGGLVLGKSGGGGGGCVLSYDRNSLSWLLWVGVSILSIFFFLFKKIEA